MRMDVYFIAPQKNRPSLFGSPLIVPCNADTKNSDLYSSVWQQISRFVSAPSPGDDLCSNRENGYPFELKVVTESGLSCAVCPWFKFCRGCTIDSNDEQFSFNCQYIAIEWEPTTLHLRYQSSQEKVFTEHESVEQSRRCQTEPIDLYECFKAFTKEEELGEDELWYCSKCKKHQLASKKLDIWSLPPILIIHLKRFQFMNGRWVKSNKIVNFPMENFDPSEFVVKRSATKNCDTREGSACVRTVNVQTVVENMLGQPETNICDIKVGTSSGQSLLSSDRKHKESSDSGASSNSSGYSSYESCVVNECNTNMNEDSDHSSQSTGTEKHSVIQKHLNEDKHSGATEEHSDEEKHLGKVQPIVVDTTIKETTAENETGKDSVTGKATERNCTDNTCGTKIEVDRVSNSSSTSKTSDVNCVGINSIDSYHVESSSVDLLTEQNVTQDSEHSCRIPHVLYNLYTISSHAGVMGGGHYVSFSKNRNLKWYCFNDSSCKETSPERVQKESPYLLFYERVGMDYKQFQPDIQDRNPDSSNDDDEIDNELKKACVLQ